MTRWSPVNLQAAEPSVWLHDVAEAQPDGSFRMPRKGSITVRTRLTNSHPFEASFFTQPCSYREPRLKSISPIENGTD